MSFTIRKKPPLDLSRMLSKPERLGPAKDTFIPHQSGRVQEIRDAKPEDEDLACLAAGWDGYDHSDE